MRPPLDKLPRLRSVEVLQVVVVAVVLLQYVQDVVLQVVVVPGPLHEVVLQVVVAGPSSASELVAEAADELVAELVATGPRRLGRTAKVHCWRHHAATAVQHCRDCCPLPRLLHPAKPAGRSPCRTRLLQFQRPCIFCLCQTNLHLAQAPSAHTAPLILSAILRGTE